MAYTNLSPFLSPVWVRLGRKAQFESDFVGEPNDNFISPSLP